MTLFIGFALFGALLLAIAAFSGGDDEGALDGGDGTSPGILSLKTVSLFLTGFGLAGAIATSLLSPAQALIASVIGVLGGIGFAALGYQLFKLIHNQQATSLFSNDDLVGKQAQISISIPKSGVGQVSCEINSKRVYREARSKDREPINEGESVYIRDIEGGILIVERWGDLD
jgi:membrane protein implicated in regulation of membrane protease activity